MIHNNNMENNKMQFKIGDMVRETLSKDIGRVIGVPNEKSTTYLVSYDTNGKRTYTEAQIASGILRRLDIFTP